MLSPSSKAARPLRLAVLLPLVLAFGCPGDDDAKVPAAPPTAPEAELPDDPTLRLIEVSRRAHAAEHGPSMEAELAKAEATGNLLARGQYDAAVAVLEPIVAEHPELQKPRLLLALAHHKSKRYALARPLWEAVLRAGPVFEKSESALYYYGYCLYYLGEPGPAKAAFLAFLDVAEREDDDAHFGIGLCDIEFGDLDDAQTHFTRALELIDAAVKADPREGPRLASSFAKVNARLGEVAMLEDRLQEARAFLERAVTTAPRAYEAWFLLSRVYTRLDETRLAEQARQQHDHWKHLSGRSDG